MMNPINEEAPPVLQCDDRGGVAILTLKCPAKLNTLSNDLLAAIVRALDDIEIDPAVRVIVLQAYSGEETHTVWTGTIKRLIHRYLEHRNKRRVLRRGSAENKLVAPYEGRRWCDATERELIDNITNSHGSHL